MNPENEAERQTAMAAARDKKTFQKAVAANDAFEFCRSVSISAPCLMSHVLAGSPELLQRDRASCRTSSMSTVHGNGYISEKRHCLSQVPAATDKMPSDVEVVAGAQGESCDAVCGRKGWHCDGRFISSVNTCEILTKHFP